MDCLSPFLSEQRAAALMQALRAQEVPVANARRIVLVPHDLRILDSLLSALVGRLRERCDALIDATRCGNELRKQQAGQALQADLAIFRAYTQEIVARRLPSDLFPRTNAAIKERSHDAF